MVKIGQKTTPKLSVYVHPCLSNLDNKSRVFWSYLDKIAGIKWSKMTMILVKNDLNYGQKLHDFPYFSMA
jgi:hypothetical protein